MWYDMLLPLAFLVVWFLLMRFILPAFGVPTCMSGACRISNERKNELQKEKQQNASE